MDIGILNSFFFFYSGKIFFHISLKISRFYPRQQNPCGHKVFMVFFFSAFILLLLLFYSSFFSSNKAVAPSAVSFIRLLFWVSCRVKPNSTNTACIWSILSSNFWLFGTQSKTWSCFPLARRTGKRKKNCSERQLMKTWAINEHPMIVDYWRLIHIRTSPLQQNFAVLIFFASCSRSARISLDGI